MDLINILFAKALNKEDATKEYVNEAIKALKGEVNADLDTLEELSKALGNDPDFFLTVKNEFDGFKTELVTNKDAATENTRFAIGVAEQNLEVPSMEEFNQLKDEIANLDSVLYTPQALTTEQQEQARVNIGAADVVAVNELKGDLVRCMIKRKIADVEACNSFDDFTNIGIYNIYSSDIQRFNDKYITYPGILVVFCNIYITQVYIALNNTMLFRAKFGDTWLAWEQIALTSALDECAKSVDFESFRKYQEMYNANVDDAMYVKIANPSAFIPHKGLSFVTGNEYDASYRRHTDYIDMAYDYVEAVEENDFKIALFAYDQEDTYIGAWNGDEFVASSQLDADGSGWHEKINIKQLRIAYPEYKFKANVKLRNNESIYINPRVVFLRTFSSKATDDFVRLEQRILEKLDNQWLGKRWTAYGDSISTYAMTSNGWGRTVNDNLGFDDCYMRGIGGSAFAFGTNGGSVAFVNADGTYHSRNDSYNYDTYIGTVPDGCTKVRASFCSWARITAMFPESIKDGIDMVFVMGGTNDSPNDTAPEWVESSEIDKEWAASEYYATFGGDYNINTIQGGVASTIMKMQAWMPNAVIVVGTPINGKTLQAGTNRPGEIPNEYHKAKQVKDVANMFGCPVIDMFASCKINVLNSAQYIYDGVHPNDKGCKLIGEAVACGLIGVYPNTSIE